MRFSSLFGIALLPLVVSFSGAEDTVHQSSLSYSQIGGSVIIVGKLGLPLGRIVCIEGSTRAVDNDDMFSVDTVDGKMLPKPILINIPGTQAWPRNTRAALVGTERGELRYLFRNETGLPAVEGGGPSSEEPVKQMLDVTFVVSKVVEITGSRKEKGQ
jgi:hypothetical protein